jgi:hypothetical protein
MTVSSGDDPTTSMVDIQELVVEPFMRDRNARGSASGPVLGHGENLLSSVALARWVFSRLSGTYPAA